MKQILSTRSLRTFVLRQGRLTQGQQKNLDDYWPRIGVDVLPEQSINPATLFDTMAPIWLEIGFGNGESLVEMAAAHPGVNFLGIEVHLPGVGHALGEIASRALSNVRVIRYDAVELLDKSLLAGSIERVMLFFPDPWPKKRHQKRRMVSAEFAKLLNRILVKGGVFHTATDWPPYAEQIEHVMAECGYFVPCERADQIVNQRPPTKFETRGVKLGHPVTDLVYQLS